MNRIFLAMGAGLLFIACSSSSSTAGPSGDQACTDQAHARCSKNAECSQYGFHTRYSDAAECEAREKKQCLAAMAAPSTAKTPAGTEACVATFPTYTCDQWTTNNPPAACGAKSGGLANGSPCAYESQCASTHCAIADNFGCGRCQDVAKAGDPCTSTPQCGRDMYCPIATGACTPTVQQGGACDGAALCAGGLSCVGASPTARGTCQPSLTQLGAACDPKQKDAAGCSRNAGLYCDPQSKQCATITWANAGQPCATGTNSGSYCAASGLCLVPQGQTMGTCVGAAADGQPCDTNAGPGCFYPATCVITSGSTGTCQVVDATTCK